jgi:DNA polymerase III sliding clamp (beta) subunit (PCNA family)
VFEFKGGAGSAVQVTLSVRTQNGFKREVVYADVLSGNADGFKIAFNPKYLADALRNADGGLTRIAFRKAENPIRLTPDDEERENLYKYIVVPVRL